MPLALCAAPAREQASISAVLSPRAALWVAQLAKASFLCNTLVSFPVYMQPCQARCQQARWLG